MNKGITIGFIMLVLLTSNFTFSQSRNTIDSLSQLLQTEEHDTSKVRLYALLSRDLMQVNMDSAIHIANQGLFLAKKIEFDNGIGDIYNAKGHIEVVQNNLFQALEYYEKSAAAFIKSGNKENESIAYLLLGNVSYIQGNLPSALEYYQRGLVIADSLHLINILPHFYNNIGGINSTLEKFDVAIEIFNKGLIINEDTNDSLGVARILINLSMIYTKLENYDHAKNYLDRAHQIYKNTSNFEGLFNVFDGYAAIENQKGNYQKAIEYHKKSFENLQKIGQDYLGPTSMLKTEYHSNIGICYLKSSNLILAEQNLLKGYEIAENTGQIEFLKITSDNLSRLYETRKDLEKSLKYSRLFKVYSDSISHEENIKKLTQLEMQFEFDKKNKERELEQTRKDAIQKRKELVYTMLSSVILLALVILFLLFRLQKGKTKRSNIEREKLRADLGYRNKELTTNVMYLLKKNEFVISISNKLKKAKYDFKPENRALIEEILRDIDFSAKEINWKDFEVRFQNVHSDFNDKLTTKFPDITPNELKLCAFLRLNMSTKEISALTFQSENSISKARYRLRKKLGVESYDNLIMYLTSL